MAKPFGSPEARVQFIAKYDSVMGSWLDCPKPLATEMAMALAEGSTLRRF